MQADKGTLEKDNSRIEGGSGGHERKKERKKEKKKQKKKKTVLCTVP